MCGYRDGFMYHCDFFYFYFFTITNLIVSSFQGDKTGKVEAIRADFEVCVEVQRKSADWALSLKIGTGGG